MFVLEAPTTRTTKGSRRVTIEAARGSLRGLASSDEFLSERRCVPTHSHIDPRTGLLGDACEIVLATRLGAKDRTEIEPLEGPGLVNALFTR